jgi:hypothetical protein
VTHKQPREHPPWWVRAADLAALALVGLAVLAFLTGGARTTIAGLPLSVTRPAHLVAEAAVILLLRALAWRRAGAPGDLLLMAAFAAFVLSLAGDSGPRRVGDGSEYMAMARQLGRLSGPTIGPEDIEYFSQQPWGDIDGHRAGDQGLRGADQRQDFIHFWFYPLLAAPLVRLAEAVGVHPNWGFTALNVLLLLGTAVVLIRRLDGATLLLLLCGPILWWIDKAHTEVFTFTMLAIGVALLRNRPWWSMVAFGAASTQNPPISAVLGLFLVWTVLAGRWRDSRVRLGAAAGIALAILPAVYYYWRLGAWFPLRGAVWPHWPGIAAFTAVLWDPNLGMLLFAPPWTLAVAMTAVVLAAAQPARLVRAELCFAIVAAGWFLFSFSQAINVNSGGTFGPSRYGLWLLPLTVPLFQQAVEWGGRDRARWLRAAAMLAVVWVPLVAQPRFNENNVEPSRLAAWLWTRWPSADNPLPEVFTERVARRELDLVLPIGTPACEKALLVATGSRGVLWPPQCRSQPVPPACASPGTLCYANRTGASYAFRVAPSQPAFGFAYRVVEAGGR